MLTQLFLKLTLVGAEWVLWVLVLLSFVSVGIIVDRLWYFAEHRVDVAELAAKLESFLRQGDLKSAWQLVAGSDAIECVVVAAGLAAISRGSQACSEAMLSAKARTRSRLEARLAILGTIGSNAPFIGLLGTVLGIVKAAHEMVTAENSQNANQVMAGVFEALVATAVGLCVAIPAVVAYNLLQRRVRTTNAQVDSLAHLVLSSMRADRSPQPVASQSR
ncbi:MAG TPA: MotA/TolQ/ExbB proton channel family protein [Pirellulales bacterium]|nr:MotA/TolQ/ExbB proton channel family protein [Pirellulales bacterium]